MAEHIFRMPVSWGTVAKAYESSLKEALKRCGVSNYTLSEPTKTKDCSGNTKFTRGRTAFPKSVEEFVKMQSQQKVVCVIAQILRTNGFTWEEISNFTGGYTYSTIYKWAFDLLQIQLR